MRLGYIVAMAGMLAAAPAMAQVVVTTPNPGAAVAHDYQADQDRAAGHQDMNAARANAAAGNYAAAEQDREAAHENFHSAHHQEHKADRDGTGGVTLQVR